MKYIKDWEKSLNIKERFNWANEEQQKQILAEIEYQREQGYLKGKLNNATTPQTTRNSKK